MTSPFIRKRIQKVSAVQRSEYVTRHEPSTHPGKAIGLLPDILKKIKSSYKRCKDSGFTLKGSTIHLSGTSGTGNTFAVESIAHTLNVPIYRIDLGTLVSKYIGETEKNLNALFNTAEREHAVLLFDEADSLFGNRSASSDAHDRYTNSQTNWILKRIEQCTTLVVLAGQSDKD